MSAKRGVMVVHDFESVKEQAARLIVNLSALETSYLSDANSRLEEATTALEDLMARVASTPDWWDRLLIWRVQMGGFWGALKTPKFVEEAACNCCGFAQESEGESALYLGALEEAGDIVEQVGAKLGVWSDRPVEPFAVDHKSWWFSVWANDAMAHRICSLFHQEFAYEVRARQLACWKRAGGPWFPDFYNADMAEKYLQSRQPREE